MLRRVFASLTLTCACLVVANAKAEVSNAEALATPFEVAHMAYQGQFTGWGIPAAGTFCYDVNSIMLIDQDLAYAYLLETGFVDSLLTPTEGAIISQGQAQVKGKDVPVAQGQTQAQGQAQGQAQVKGKDVPVAQGQAQGQAHAQVKGKDVPVAQGQAQVKGKDVPVAQGQTQAQGQAQVKAKDLPVSQGKLIPSQQQQQIQTKGKLISNQQGQSSSMIARSDLDIRRFVDYTNALTDDEVRLVRENFDEQFLRDLSLQMRYMCNE